METTTTPLRAHIEHYKAKEKVTHHLEYVVHTSSFQTDDRPPLILSLHDIPTTDCDLAAVRRSGLPAMIEDGLRLPAVVLAPLGPGDTGMWCPEVLRFLVDHAVHQYGCDPTRIYLTGVGMGAFGCYVYTTHHPVDVAAQVVIRPHFVDICHARLMAKVPTWCGISLDDPEEQVQAAMDVTHMQRLPWAGVPGRAPGYEHRLTIDSRIGVPVWRTFYRDESLWKWLFGQRSDPKGVVRANDSIPEVHSGPMTRSDLHADDTSVEGVPTARRLTLDGTADRDLPYLWYPPKDATGPVPLVVFLHGAGQVGAPVEQVAQRALPKCMEGGLQVPAFVAAPRCPAWQVWPPRLLRAWIDDLCRRHPIDRNRIYITGESFGGTGTWQFAAAFPDLPAVIVPIVASGWPSFLAKRIAHIPCRAYSGVADHIGVVRLTVEMGRYLRAAGGDPDLRFLIDGYHGIAEGLYDAEFFTWLLSQCRLPVAQSP